MEVIKPQITYSPDGILQIAAGLAEDYVSAEYHSPESDATRLQDRLQILEKLGRHPAQQVTIDDNGFRVAIDMHKSPGNNPREMRDIAASLLLRQIGALVPFRPNDAIDRVISTSCLDETRATFVVNRQFQRWLNAHSLTEAVSRQATLAMAVPYGSSAMKTARKKYRYSTSDTTEQATSHTMVALVKHSTRTIAVASELSQATKLIPGKVRWGHVTLRTIGSQANITAQSGNLERSPISPTNPRLYSMESHHAKNGTQLLSLLLGQASLAYAAAQYMGQEDILSSLILDEPEIS